MRKEKKSNSRFDSVIRNNILSKSKRSQVSVLVLVLIILIILISVLVVWNLVVPLVREKGEEVETSSFLSTSLLGEGRPGVKSPSAPRGG